MAYKIKGKLDSIKDTIDSIRDINIPKILFKRYLVLKWV